MIKLKTLKFNNCFSYGANNEIDFTKNNVNLLNAPNGSGKSSLIYILQEVLASKNIKKLKKDEIPNRYTDKDGYDITLTFDKYPDSYSLTVVRKGKTGKVKLLKNGKDISEHKIPDTYKLVNNIFGDIDLAFQLIYQSSEDLLEFLKATDTNRKKFLIKLCNLQKYLDIGESVKLILSNKEKELIKLQGEIKSVNDFIDDTVIPDKMDKKELPIFDDLSDAIITLSSTINNYKDKDKLISKNNIYVQERDSLVFDVNMKFDSQSVIDNFNKSLEEARQNVSSITSEITNTKKQLKSLDTTDICYACGQKIDVSDSKKLEQQLNESLKDLENKKTITQAAVDAIISELKIVEEEKEKVKSNNDKIKRFEELSNLVDNSLPSTQEDYNDLIDQLSNLKRTQKDNENQLKEIVDYNNQVDNRNTQIKTLIQQKQNFYARQELLNNDILKIQSQVNSLNIIKKAFSASGIVAYKLENYTKNFEDTINEYLNELSDGQFQLIFRLDKEKLNIVIINDGKECSIESLSKGEFSRVQFSVLLGIRKILSQINGESVNLLFLDEITGVLDSSGKYKLVDILLEEQDTNVFIVSHDFEHPLMEKVNIIKENNISRLEQ